MCVKYSTVVNVVKGFKGKHVWLDLAKCFFLNWAILATLFKYLWKMKSTLTIFHSCQWPPNIEQTIWPSAHTVWLNHRQDSMGTVEMKGYSAPLSTLVPLVELRSLSSEWISYRPRISLSSQNFQEFLFQQWQRFFLSLSVCYTPLSLSFIRTHDIPSFLLFISQSPIQYLQKINVKNSFCTGIQTHKLSTTCLLNVNTWPWLQCYNAVTLSHSLFRKVTSTQPVWPDG